VALFGAVLLAIVFGMKLASFDGLPAYFFTDFQGLLIAIIILAILLLSVLLLAPRYFLSHRASAYLLLDDTALTGTNAVVLRDAGNSSLYQTSPSAKTDSESDGTASQH
jgi:membrane protein implicated in regulation of membrane protease activity